MTEIFGYARVSWIDQDLKIQRAALKNAGAKTIRAEKKSRTSRKGRTELQFLMKFMRKGDTLLVTRIDRLARSLRDLQNIVHEWMQLARKRDAVPIIRDYITDLQRIYERQETEFRQPSSWQ